MNIGIKPENPRDIDKWRERERIGKMIFFFRSFAFGQIQIHNLFVTVCLSRYRVISSQLPPGKNLTRFQRDKREIADRSCILPKEMIKYDQIDWSPRVPYQTYQTGSQADHCCQELWSEITINHPVYIGALTCERGGRVCNKLLFISSWLKWSDTESRHYNNNHNQSA